MVERASEGGKQRGLDLHDRRDSRRLGAMLALTLVHVLVLGLWLVSVFNVRLKAESARRAEPASFAIGALRGSSLTFGPMGSADVEEVGDPALEAETTLGVDVTLGVAAMLGVEATLRVEPAGDPAKAVTRPERQAVTASALSLIGRARVHFIVAATFELASTAQARPSPFSFSHPLYRSVSVCVCVSLSLPLRATVRRHRRCGGAGDGPGKNERRETGSVRNERTSTPCGCPRRGYTKRSDADAWAKKDQR